MNFSSLLNPAQNGLPAPDPAAGDGDAASSEPVASSSRMSFAFLDSAASRPMTPVFASTGSPVPPPGGFVGAAPSAFELHQQSHPMSIHPYDSFAAGFDPRLLTVQPQMLVDPAALLQPQPYPQPMQMDQDAGGGIVADSDDESSRKPLINGSHARATPIKAEDDSEVDIMSAGDETATLAALKAQARASPAPKPRSKSSAAKGKSRSAHLASSVAGSPAPSPGPSSLANEVHAESSPAPSAVAEAPIEPEAPDYSFLPDMAPNEYHHPRLAPSVPRPRLAPAFEAYVPPRRSRFGADANDSSSSDEDEDDVKRREQRRKAQAAAARERRLKAAKRGAGGGAEEEDDRLYCICQTLYDPERMMIACDRCEEWYHTDCVQIDEDRVELVDLFICPNCQSNSFNRTTWKSCCARPTCRHPAVPLSKYCSDYCGVAVAAARLSLLEVDAEIDPVDFWDLVKGATRREAHVVEAVAGGEDNPQSLQAKSHARQDLADARLREKILARMSEATRIRTGLEAAIRLVEQRLAYLRVAIRRWETLCQATADEMVSAGIDLEEAAGQKGGGGGRKSRGKRSGQSKKKGPVAATSLPDAQCGFDVRLVFDDKDWQATIGTEPIRSMLAAQADGDEVRLVELVKGDMEGVCLETRKGCDRHQGWQKIREADFAVEKAVLSRRLERLSLLSDSLSTRLTQHDETVAFRLANRSRTCPPEKLIDVEDFMLDRQEELEEQKAARPLRARREERSPSLHATNNGGGRHVAAAEKLSTTTHGGQAARSRGASTTSHESTPAPATGAGGANKAGGDAPLTPGDDVPDELLPYLSRAAQARIKAQRERTARAA